MRNWMNALGIVLALGCAGCGAPVPDPSTGSPAAGVAAVAPIPRQVSNTIAGPGPPAAVGHSESRTIEDDPDADGIPDYRLVITDTFDAGGNLVSTLREEDFEADGIIDARVMTSFGG